jgi:hypothetical protein
MILCWDMYIIRVLHTIKSFEFNYFSDTVVVKGNMKKEEHCFNYCSIF